MADIVLSDVKTETEAGGQILVTGIATFNSGYTTGGQLMDLSAYILSTDVPHVVAGGTTAYVACHNRGTAAAGKLIAIKTTGGEENNGTNTYGVKVFFIARGDAP